MRPLKIAGILKESVVDGPGLRTVVFVQGCYHHCDGCHNPDTWDPKKGTETTVDEIWEQIKDEKLIQGITISGGEPVLYLPQVTRLTLLAKENGWDVVMYTGHTWEWMMDLCQVNDVARTLLSNVDLLVDGPFVQELKSLDLPFRGSSNQRLIRSAESIRQGELVLWDPLKEDL
jgi:anaerobic ribonucleoside-triphosphate reductase activating protein